MNNNECVEGIHYYYDEAHNVVFTQVYHLQKGYCCGFGCKHCPYQYEAVPEPKKSELVRLSHLKNQS